MGSLLVQNILQKHKITDYLAAKGILPDGGERNGKLFYKCPLHIGDNTPSFVVYTQSGEYENFYCYGCKARYNIIHLYRDLEKITTAEAIGRLGEGISVTDEAELNHALEIVSSDRSVSAMYTPDDLALQIARQLHEFLAIVEHDPVCVAATEKMYDIIDRASEQCDLDALAKIYEMLPDVIVKRVNLYNEQKERKIMSQAS